MQPAVHRPLPFRPLLAGLLLGLATLPGLAVAQEAAAAPAPVADEAATPALEPFIASYMVYRDGKHLGEATMQLVPMKGSRWRVDLVMHGTRGLIGLAGINAEQSTVFDVVGETYRPLTQATLNRTLFTRKQTIGLYDWSSRSASWQGDVKESRQRPVELQPGDMTGLLINLAVIRDAEPGATLKYRFVDDGRTREHVYTVAAEPEKVSAADLSFSAFRAVRDKDDNEETLIWVARNVPTPIRMLKREDGKDAYDLRLVEYKGVE